MRARRIFGGAARLAVAAGALFVIVDTLPHILKRISPDVAWPAWIADAPPVRWAAWLPAQRPVAPNYQGVAIPLEAHWWHLVLLDRENWAGVVSLLALLPILAAALLRRRRGVPALDIATQSRNYVLTTCGFSIAWLAVLLGALPILALAGLLVRIEVFEHFLMW